MDAPKLTNPYGSLAFAVGSEDDFFCFDYHIDEANKRVLLHAVVNSETANFIQDHAPPKWISYADNLLSPYEAAQELVYKALEWCHMGGDPIEHDQEGWNQDPMYFARAVHAAITHTGPAIRIAVDMVRRPINTGSYL